MTLKLAITGSVRWIVSVNGVDLPGTHREPVEAVERAVNLELANPGDVVEYRPEGRVRVEVRGVAPAPAPTPPPAPVPPAVPSAEVLFQWDATAVAPFFIHAKDQSRVSLVNVGGRPAVRLLTMPGDSNLFGSGANERCDLRLGNAETDAVEGRKHWWKWSIWLPEDYVDPILTEAVSWPWGVLMNFHNTADQGGQANVQVHHWPSTGLHCQVSGGDPANPTVKMYAIGPVVRNTWLDFEMEVFWTSTPAGYCNGWLNGRQFMAHTGPTLYTGQGAYLKLANYHTAHGRTNAVLLGRVVSART